MIYSVVLYIHVLAALLLASTLAIEMMSLWRIGGAKSLSEARLWIGLAPGLPSMVGLSGLVLLISGGYLTAKMAGFSLGWPKMAVIAMLLIAPLGAFTARRMKRIRQILRDETNATSVAERLNDRSLRVSLSVRTWIFAGIVLLMTAKPNMTTSILIIGVSAVLGVISALMGYRAEKRLPTFDPQTSTRKHT